MTTYHTITDKTLQACAEKLTQLYQVYPNDIIAEVTIITNGHHGGVDMRVSRQREVGSLIEDLPSMTFEVR